MFVVYMNFRIGFHFSLPIYGHDIFPFIYILFNFLQKCSVVFNKSENEPPCVVPALGGETLSVIHHGLWYLLWVFHLRPLVPFNF